MGYKINAKMLGEQFTLPKSIASKHIKLAGSLQLKVLLLIFSDLSNDIDAQNIANKLGADKQDVEDALGFWAQLGYLEGQKPAAQTDVKKPAVSKEIKKPTRNEVADMAADNPEITFLLREAQVKFGRTLRDGESSTLTWLVLEQGMPVSVLLMVLDYAVNSGRGTMGYIEKTAIDFINCGIDTIESAEERIKLLTASQNAWNTVSRTFGLARRSPSKKEAELCHKWVYIFGFSPALLKEGYDITVDNIGEFKINYIDKIFEDWHKAGVTSLEQARALIQGKKEEKKEQKAPSYDKKMFRQKLESDLNRGVIYGFFARNICTGFRPSSRCFA
ncbi:MAG: DnaD domain protein [Oscillospiraceae bacterium]|nr:DnaD domain protein [Candidatus Equicaccousia limihippi]